jgi:hypothetical protein
MYVFECLFIYFFVQYLSVYLYMWIVFVSKILCQTNIFIICVRNVI